MKNLIIIFMLSMCAQLSAQNQLKVEIGQGLFFTDLLFDDSDGVDRFSGWGWLTTGNIYFSKDVGEKFNLDLGVGYSNYYFLDFNATENYLPYFNTRFVVNYQSFLKKTDLTLGVTHHILLFNELETNVYNRRRAFTNLDLGFVFHPGKKWDVKVTTPITVRAMYKDEFGAPGPSEVVWTKYWVGTMGLNLSLAYKFNLGKEK